MEILENGPKVLIRKYRYGDEKAIIRLVNEGTMVTVNPFFFRAATREMIVSYLLKLQQTRIFLYCMIYQLRATFFVYFQAQVILMLSAILFIVVGTSLKYR